MEGGILAWREESTQKRKTFQRLALLAILAIVGVLVFHGAAQAVSLAALCQSSPGCMGTIPSITVDDKVFDSFQVIENDVHGDTTGRMVVNLANIDVTPWFDILGNPGLLFTPLANELRITQAGVSTAGLDLDFIFRVRSLGAPINDNHLEGHFDGTCGPGPFSPPTNPCSVSGVAFADHSAEIRERLFSDNPFTDPGSFLGIEKDIHREVDTSVGFFDDESGVPIWRDFTPRADVWVLKDLTLLTAFQGEFSEIVDVRQTFSQIPEPGTWLLLTTGLVGLLGYGWRRKKLAA